MVQCVVDGEVVEYVVVVGIDGDEDFVGVFCYCVQFVDECFGGGVLKVDVVVDV